MAISKQQRAALREMFGGVCAYCGQPLGDTWHADHVLPVRRNTEYVAGSGFSKAPGAAFPNRDDVSNMVPACAPCNLDKSVYTLNEWREKLQRSCNVLKRNQPTYRHALRFGLIEERPPMVEFHFERLERLANNPQPSGD